ncbi:MAG: sugar phosphate isomerase/epimerase [Propionibacteriaceae bacterium]|nr:sugar phosphate isomerase/epimerase [Propionibacteriaceae bacterium]
MLDPRRVLREMTSLGLTETEQGSPGFFPDDVGQLKEILDEFGVTVIADFVPLPLHDTAQKEWALEKALAMAKRLNSLGATTFVSCAITDPQWSNPHRMDSSELKVIADSLNRLEEICAEHGLVHTLHPHLNSMVEVADDVKRVAEACDVKWTIDTGHLMLGGYDPMEFAKDLGDRVSHAHLKDVNASLADQVISREISLLEATEKDIFLPFGQGDVPIADIVSHLEQSGYKGWYVLERDTTIVGPEPPEGEGPVNDLRICVDYMREHFPNGL